jgi:signal recognition particle subunit SRP54
LFEAISDKFDSVFSKIRGSAKLTEENISGALREIRMALLEADVNYKVVKTFIGGVEEKALGEDVVKKVTPGQQFIKIVHDEMVELLGGGGAKLLLSGNPPIPIMVVGLMGSGKTTSSGKLGLYLKDMNKSTLLVPADTRRPAAREQLISLGDKIGVEVFDGGGEEDPVKICANACSYAAKKGINSVIMDTAGRLHVDDGLMSELAKIKGVVNPREILLVADAMSGQDAVNVAEKFHETLGLTGIMLTKLDGDARGGAAISIKAVSGAPIKFVGTGENLKDIMPFEPERMAGRILGMGDVVTFVEKAQEAVDQKKSKELEKKLKKGGFTLDDFLDQIKSIKKMGSIEGLIGMIPGMKGLSGSVNFREAEDELKKIEAIINSMTIKERENHVIVNGSRRKRIAKGSGTRVEDVNRLLKRYATMKKMMKKISKGGLKNLQRGGMPFPM